MPSEVTTHLVALALQKLEALQSNEAEVLSDEKCLERAMEVAEISLQAVAVCTKTLLSRHAEARIPGLGLFHLEKDQIQFVPDSDVIQFTLLKHRKADQLQISLRNAFVTGLFQTRNLVPLLDFSSAESATTSVVFDNDLATEVLGETEENDFGRAVSALLNEIATKLEDAGVHLDFAKGKFEGKVESSWILVDEVEKGWTLTDREKERVRPEAGFQQNKREESAG